MNGATLQSFTAHVSAVSSPTHGEDVPADPSPAGAISCGRDYFFPKRRVTRPRPGSPTMADVVRQIVEV